MIKDVCDFIDAGFSVGRYFYSIFKCTPSKNANIYSHTFLANISIKASGKQPLIVLQCETCDWGSTHNLNPSI